MLIEERSDRPNIETAHVAFSDRTWSEDHE